MAAVVSCDPLFDGFPRRDHRLSYENQYQCCCCELHFSYIISSINFYCLNLGIYYIILILFFI